MDENFNVFSKRQRAGSSLRFEFPQEIRSRILHALQNSLNQGDGWASFEGMLNEVGNQLLVLYGGLTSPFYEAVRQSDHPVVQHFFSCDEPKALDYIEICFRSEALSGCENAVQMVNAILRDGQLGYQLSPFIKREVENSKFHSGKSYTYDPPRLICTESDFLHEEAMQPALAALGAPEYHGASEEFLRALEHFRKGLFPECLNECLKCFESTMKIIAEGKGWGYSQNDTARRLIQICIDQGLVTSASQQQLTSIRTLLESGVPTLRNKRSGHGQGVQKNEVPEPIAKFALNMTASTVVFLVEMAM